MEATRNSKMELADGDGDKKGEGEGGERCSRSSGGKSIDTSGSDEKKNLTGNDEEEKKKKSVYAVMIEYLSYHLRLMRINPHDTSSSSGFQDVTPKVFPPEFNNLRYYRVAALEPNLYFVGGYRPFEKNVDHPIGTKGLCTNGVLVFNTLTEKWVKSFPSMRLARAYPKVVICNKMIYVFGYDNIFMRGDNLYHHRTEGIPHNHWAEFYNPDYNEWKYLEAENSPPDVLVEVNFITITAVCEEQQCILFCVHGVAVYGYRVDKKNWFELKPTAFTGYGLSWSDSVAVSKSFLFWHHSGTIYVNRLFRDSPSSQLFTLPNALYLFGKRSTKNRPWQSYLVNAGNGVLGLLYQCSRDIFPEEEKDQLAFHKFELQHSPSEDPPSLHSPDYRRTHRPAKNSQLIDVFVM